MYNIVSLKQTTTTPLGEASDRAYRSLGVEEETRAIWVKAMGHCHFFSFHFNAAYQTKTVYERCHQ